MNIRLPFVIALTAALAVPAGAFAQQEYPAKSVRPVPPFITGSSPAAFASLINNDTARLGKAIRNAEIRAE
ncbi:MAG TPA: hypothetical protein VLT92_17475 [Burkholderiales bacterium]|nr:hypothetical protein [Burkholderiales bacterium]